MRAPKFWPNADGQSVMATSEEMIGKAKNKPTGGLTLFAELKPRLSVVHAVLDVPKTRYERGTTIKVLKSHIQVTQKSDESTTDADETNTVVLQNVSLIPASCHGLKWVPGDGMHFRMQICRQEEGQESLEIPNGKSTVSTEERLAPFKALPLISCKMCGQTILHKRFSRVRLLPSADWDEWADQMFCHPHRDDVPDCHILSPGQGDCLVGEQHVVLREDDMSWKGIIRGTKNVLHCQRCKIILGKQIELGHTLCVQLSIHYLTVGTEDLVTPPCDKLTRMQRVEMWFTDFLLTESSTHNSCRLLIESETEATKTSPYILLWVLESNVVLYSGGATTRDKSPLTLSPQPILKVLYRDCVREKNKGCGKQWREDFTVHSVTLPHDLCKQMLLMLVESSKLLPRSLQSANGFYVGFLRKKEHP